MDDRIRDLIFQAIDETMSPEDFERLQDALEHDAEVRDAYLKAVGLCESLGEIATESQMPDSDSWSTGFSLSSRASQPEGWTTTGQAKAWTPAPARQFAVAATVLIIVNGFAFWAGRSHKPSEAKPIAITEQSQDGANKSRIAGHATLRRAVGLTWPDDARRHLEGNVLPNGLLAFDTGLAEIDFFCGATLIVEGPAQLEIESDWSVRVKRGRLRSSVPPAARGFSMKAADSEIIDLGTEFAVEVDSGNARVEVIDGEVELRGGMHDGRHLLTGEGELLAGSPATTDLAGGLSTFSELSLQRREADEKLLAR